MNLKHTHTHTDTQWVLVVMLFTHTHINTISHIWKIQLHLCIHNYIYIIYKYITLPTYTHIHLTIIMPVIFILWLVQTNCIPPHLTHLTHITHFQNFYKVLNETRTRIRVSIWILYHLFCIKILLHPIVYISYRIGTPTHTHTHTLNNNKKKKTQANAKTLAKL